MFDIETYLKLLLHWLWLLLLGAVAGVLVTNQVLVYLGLFPQYIAVATLIVGGQLEATTVSESELSIGQDLVPNYVVLAKRPPITDAVIQNLNLGISTDELVTYKLEVAQDGQTRIVLITGKDTDPEYAAAIANETALQLQGSGPVRPTELIQIVSLAKVPEKPSTEPYLIMALGGLVGLLLFAMVAVFIELVRDRPLTLSWAAARIHIPVLGTFQSNHKISTLRRWLGMERALTNRGQPGPVWWVVMRTFDRALSQRVVIERFERALGQQTVMERFERATGHSMETLPPGQGRVLLVTSPNGSPSKATAALELARAWATTGERVILVDGDPSHPTMHRWFRVANDTGITSLLSPNGRGDRQHEKMLANQFESMVFDSEIDNLRVVTSGPRPAEASVLLYRQAWQEAILVLTRQADVVIVISPSVSAGSEAIIPAAHASAVLLVIDLGKTGAAEANRASDTLIQTGSTVLGAVVNIG